MKTEVEREKRAFIQFHKRARAGLCGLMLLLPVVVATGGGVVTHCTEADLRAAMNGGGMVTFACDGTITLASTITNDLETTLDGTGHQVTISGGNAVRVFYRNTNATLTLLRLVLANGWSTNHGGGIYNAGGTVNATNCTFFGNGAVVAATPCTGEPGYGGAIYNAGAFRASGCTFSQNRAGGGNGAFGWGGQFTTPTPGDPGGPGAGGAIYNLGTMVIDRSTFAGNTATGGTGGRGGNGGDGSGGAMFNLGPAVMVSSTFAGNVATGGGGLGGSGGMILLSGHADPFPSGSGGDGGSEFGALRDANGLLHLTDRTVAVNSATPGSGGRGGSNGGGTAPAGTNGSLVGGIKSSGSLLINTLLAANLPGGNGGSPLTDAGHNLSSDATCNFTNVGSLNNTDPKLGPLAYNGGPTLTMALLPGSPAIDAGDNPSAPATDQRGVPRPVGAAPDIGAYEFTAVLEISRRLDSGISLLVSGPSGQACRLLTSTNLADWQSAATNQIGTNGKVLFQENSNPEETRRFYKMALL